MSNPSDFIIENGVLEKYNGPGGKVTIPEGVTSIGASVFSWCSSLTSVTIPNSVKIIGGSAFRGCSSLKSVGIPEGVTSIGGWAFNGCSGLTSVTIPNSVKIIGDWAFAVCSSLTSVTIPEGVTSIGDMAFYFCRGLTSVTIPGSVKSIGKWAFCGCKALTSVTIPEGVTSIGNLAFEGCSSLTSVTIPESVTSIGKDAFRSCEEIESLVILSDLKLLPAKMKPAAAVGYAENPAEPGSDREKKHLKYIKSSAVKLIGEALSHPALLGLICEKKLLTPEAADLYLAAAQEQGRTDAVALLLDYQQNRLTAKDKEKAKQKAETREEKVTDFIFSAEAIEKLQGKVFVVTGALRSFTREQFKACLNACGAVLTETLNEQTDYLITNTPDSGSAKNKKADELGVQKLSEAEFNRLIGRN